MAQDAHSLAAIVLATAKVPHGTDALGSLAQNAGGLRFNTKDDAFDYAAQIVKRGHQWAKAQGVRTPREDYLESQCEIVLQMQFVGGAKPRDFYLVVQVVPLIDYDLGAADPFNDRFGKGGSILKSGPNDCLMRRRGHFGHRPQNAVAVLSKVWLKPNTEVDESLVDPDKFLFDYYLEVLRILSEGEVDILCIFPAERDSALTEGLIERRPQVLHDVGSQSPDFWREFMLESDLDDLFSGLWIGMSDNFVFARRADCVADRFKLGKAFFSAID
jgi:hypothetical protein